MRGKLKGEQIKGQVRYLCGDETCQILTAKHLFVDPVQLLRPGGYDVALFMPCASCGFPAGLCGITIDGAALQMMAELLVEEVVRSPLDLSFDDDPPVDMLWADPAPAMSPDAEIARGLGIDLGEDN